VVKVAMTGQLASAKYLFEVVGLYPATEQTAAGPGENSLADTLLARMGLPLEPVICDEDAVPAVSASHPKGIRIETAAPHVEAEAVEGEHPEEQSPVAAESAE